ncbi:DUF2474 domain-containing protein [Algimonas porphyrae]
MRDPAGNWGSRLVWFVGLWAAGVLAVTIIGFAIRAMIL